MGFPSPSNLAYHWQIDFTSGNCLQQRGLPNSIPPNQTVFLPVCQLKRATLKNYELSNLNVYVLDANVPVLVDGLRTSFPRPRNKASRLRGKYFVSK